MPRSFGDAAAWAASFDAPDRDGWQRPAEVIALMELQPGMTVADLGAGTGYFLPHLAAAVGAGGATWGLDIEPTLVQWMNDRIQREALPSAQARLIPTDAPGLEPGSADRVLVVNTWHHLSDRAAYTPKLKAALKAGGRVVVVDYTLESDEGPPKEHRLSAEVVVAELRAAGFTTWIATEALPRQYVVIGQAP